MPPYYPVEVEGTFDTPPPKVVIILALILAPLLWMPDHYLWHGCVADPARTPAPTISPSSSSSFLPCIPPASSSEFNVLPDIFQAACSFEAHRVCALHHHLALAGAACMPRRFQGLYSSPS